LTGCGGGSGDDAEPAAGAAHADEDLGYFGESADGVEAESGGSAHRADSAVDRPAGATAALQQQAIIQVGTLTVQSDDVAAARFDLDKVVDAYRGSIADEKTTASTDGEVRLSRIVLRIPAADFDEAMIDIGKLGTVTGSTRKAEDVTGQIIDTQARIRAQEQSLQRVEVLFTRAQNIRDIVAIEAQLSRRQAELDSLKGQLAYLEDQADMSTLTVYLEPTPEKPKAEAAEKDDDLAFIGGLKDGWHALGEVGAGLATVSGALLPFVVVGLLVGVPGAVAARRWLARHPLRRPATEA
ncbi:MAG: DUF4349 domain-containing protein, partial [Nocardioides sp.]